jgi:hypothetical protein
MLPLPLTQEKYELILTNALSNAVSMLSRNSEIYKNVLPEDMLEEYMDKNDGTEHRLKMIAGKIETHSNLNTYEVSYVNRALVEYIDTLELAQSHFIYMTEPEELSKIARLRTLIEEVYVSQMRFNDDVIKNKIENGFKSEVTYNPEVILKSLQMATEYVLKNGEAISSTLDGEGLSDMQSNYIRRNDMALFAIGMARDAVESGRPLNPADVSVVNKSMVQYIQKLETAQSNMIYTLDDMKDIALFKNKIESVHFEMFKFNESYPIPNIDLNLQQRSRPPKP